MHIIALLNRHGGTLKTADHEAVTTTIRDVFTQHGHTIDVRLLEGEELIKTIKREAKSGACDVLLVGGGDGTVSAAAEELVNKKTVLGILPLGTMNLFARSLKIPLKLEAALEALATAPIVAVDAASVEGKIFVHQLSLGLQPKLVEIRDEREHRSRLGKMWGSLRAMFLAMLRLPQLHITMDVDGGARQMFTVSALVVSNNPYGEAHLPYADDPAGGVLGVYVCKGRTTGQIAQLSARLAAGTWRNSPLIEEMTGKRVMIARSKGNKPFKATLDGEMLELKSPIQVEILPGALKVLRPVS